MVEHTLDDKAGKRTRRCLDVPVIEKHSHSCDHKLTEGAVISVGAALVTEPPPKDLLFSVLAVSAVLSAVEPVALAVTFTFAASRERLRRLMVST